MAIWKGSHNGPRTVLVNASLLTNGAAVDGVDVMMSLFGGFAEVTMKVWWALIEKMVSGTLGISAASNGNIWTKYLLQK